MNTASPLAAIADLGLTAVAAPTKLATGTPDTVAQSIYELFADEHEGSNKVQFILDCTYLTFEEFNARLKTAVSMAANKDAHMGFVPSVHAKGTDKYGPKQKSMAVQVSSIRKVFGAAKQFGLKFEVDGNVVNLNKLGITNATKACAATLKAYGVDWTGKAALSDEQKVVNTKSAQFAQALAMLQTDPMNAGKSIAEVSASDVMEATILKLEAETLSNAADKMVASWVKSQDPRTVVLAATRFIAMYGTPKEKNNAIDAVNESI